jgi:hypothetical protein
MESISKKHSKCRCCGNERLTPYLDLGLTPLANNLCDTKAESLNAVILPLIVCFCDKCGLSQLSEVVNPKTLFKYYTYRSSVNAGYIDHCKEMAIELKKTYKLDHKSFHIDIAGNDGTLLSVFQKEIGHSVLNIDPAENLCKIAKKNNIPSLDRFWGIQLGKVFGKFCDLITATNVFAHLDNVTEFLEACKIALKPNGVLVIENPYFPHTMETNQFDQVYFEHVSYWSLMPMVEICAKIGLKVINCKELEIHGGSMRYVISHDDSDFEETKNVNRIWQDEFFNPDSVDIWSLEIQLIKETIITQLKDIKKQGKYIAGFAASAKGNTLMNYCGIDHKLIDFICDETPEKIGKYSPGTGIPIYDLATIEFAEPDYILILSWNFQSEIIAKLRNICPNSKYIVPIPEFKIID